MEAFSFEEVFFNKNRVPFWHPICHYLILTTTSLLNLSDQVPFE
jgi:hypothetical protein